MEWIFITGNRIPKNTIFRNNFFECDILAVFGMQIEFLGTFDKFSKNTLDGGGGNWLADSDDDDEW